MPTRAHAAGYGVAFSVMPKMRLWFDFPQGLFTQHPFYAFLRFEIEVLRSWATQLIMYGKQRQVCCANMQYIGCKF